MNINIAKIKLARGLSNKFLLEEQAQNIIFEGQEITFISPIKVIGEVVNAGSVFTVSGNAETVVKLNCSRCLDEFELPFNMSFDAVFAQHNQPDKDNDDVRIFSGDEIILDDLIIETLLLELPLKYLCNEKCKGLCTQCGQNLNNGLCGCDKSVDPRFSVLAELLNVEDKLKGV